MAIVGTSRLNSFGLAQVSTGQPFPGGAVPTGDIIFALVGGFSNDAITFTWPGGWTALQTFTPTNSVGKLELRYRISDGTVNTLVITHASNDVFLMVSSFSGAPSTVPTLTTHEGNGITFDTGTFPMQAGTNTLALSFVVKREVHDYTIPGMTRLGNGDVNSGPDLNAGIFWADVNSGADVGGVTVPGASSAAGDWAVIGGLYLGGGSAPRGLSGAPEYVVEILGRDANFGPATKLGELWDIRNLGWSKYDRIPGKAFFTLSQLSSFAGEVLAGLITPLLTHVAIWRITPTSDTLVYRGAIIDYSSTGDDIVVTCFDYKSLLSLSRTGYKTLYPTKKIGSEIVSPEWALAKGATSSPLGFVTTGTIEDPLGTDGVTPITSSSGFGTLDQNRLQFFYDLSEIGRANTVNQSTYDIDLTNTFTFLKNAGSASQLALVLNGNVSDYEYLPNWTGYRNNLATLGTTVTGGTAEIVANAPANVTSFGLRQDVTTLKTLLGISTAATEADQQQAALQRALKHAVQLQPVLQVRTVRGLVEPFVGWGINDTTQVEIRDGIDSLTIRQRILGVRVFFDDGGEDTALILGPVAT